jgi:hypothetical protein
MRRKGLKLLLYFWVVGYCSACGYVSGSSLIGSLRSYQSMEQVRGSLRDAGFADGWKEQKIGVDSKDRRPQHDFVTLAGPFEDLGCRGVLTLTFFNDRLMVAEFVPEKGTSYLESITKRIKNIPRSPQQQVPIEDRISFGYYQEPSGNLRFRWEDMRLSKEWRDWVQKHS